jgi:hypothetical protein
MCCWVLYKVFRLKRILIMKSFNLIYSFDDDSPEIIKVENMPEGTGYLCTQNNYLCYC